MPYLRYLCLLAILCDPTTPPVICIEEPELGLHPHAIFLLAGLIRKAAKKTQVIVATQSTTLVNQFTVDDVIVVDRKNDESIFSRPDHEKVKNWLREFRVILCPA